MLAVIGGSGFENFEGFKILERLSTETPFGPAASGLARATFAGSEFLFLSRHGQHHEKLPSEVNYKANIFALKKHGAQAVLSFSAAGSLQPQLHPGHLVVPDQYIDRTKSLRPHTFFGLGLVGHVSLAEPTCALMRGHLRYVVNKISTITSHFGGTYVCIEGPTFSTQAESHLYRSWNGSLVGMTHYPEYALAREAGLAYLPCCFVTDFDCWKQDTEHVTVQEVIRVMKENNQKAQLVLQKCLELKENFWKGSKARELGLKSGLFMPEEAIPEEIKVWLPVLLS